MSRLSTNSRKTKLGLALQDATALLDEENAAWAELAKSFAIVVGVFSVIVSVVVALCGGL